ncbi:hypothetical protein PENTCL1PPCAC_22793, partial [Pristionchus entomophagus]
KSQCLSTITKDLSVLARCDLTSGLLLRLLLDVNGSLSGLGNNVILLGENNLHVAGRRHVRINSAVGSVCASAHLSSTLDLDVINDEMVDIESLVLGIALSVSEQLKHVVARLHWPTSLGGLECLALSLSANSAVELAEGDDLLLLHHIGEVTLSSLKGHASDSGSDLTGVLEVNTEIRPLGFARLRAVLGLSGIMNLRHCRGLP